ncbi:hypothetical protein [uncultured Paraglaciecola sp.]|uniref:hypothetical protein n=1 Tax=uncultured Paraglaciecola sp. TaxID=1765024 RepID=UPI0026274D12|nr:hypothetical protein [uncultured Paraglaciecola sp.]
MTNPTDGYVLYNSDDECIGYGTGRPELLAGEYIIYSTDPQGEAEALAINTAFDDFSTQMNIEDWKTEAEYAGKAEDANRFASNNPAIIGDAPLIDRLLATPAQVLAHDIGDYTAGKYPWMSIVVESESCTPRECAESIIAAMKRNDPNDKGTWRRAYERQQLKMALKAQQGG